MIRNGVAVHKFKDSGVQGCILHSGLHLECLFKKKASASSGQIPNLELNWQLFRGKSIFNEDLEFLIPYLIEFAYKIIKKTIKSWAFLSDEITATLPGDFFPGPALLPTGFIHPSVRNWLLMLPLKLFLRLKR
jgi:hypothetical protein